MKSGNTNIQLIFGIVFFIILVLPNIIMWSGIEKNSDPFPEFDLADPITSFKKFDNYYKEHFGLKQDMVKTYINFKSNVLNESPLPNSVVIGKDGWYFLGNRHNELLNDSFGNLDFTPSELETITKNVTTIKSKLNAKGIAFYIVIAPNKHRIYSEKLPFQLHQGKTRLEALKSYLKKESDVNLIDLRDTLMVNKHIDPLYYKTNTHWNDLGAYIAYQKTLKTINTENDIPIINRLDFNVEYNPIERGDITEMLHIKSDEKGISFIKKTQSNTQALTSSNNHLHYYNPSGKKKLVMYRDSFANAWIKFFNESFSESIYLRDYAIDYSFIDEQKPDIVIFEIIERNLGAVLLNEKRPSD